MPGGKLLGIALVSTQNALSLVQEQVGGQRGILAFLVLDSPGTHKHRTVKHISLIHLDPSSGILELGNKSVRLEVPPQVVLFWS